MTNFNIRRQPNIYLYILFISHLSQCCSILLLLRLNIIYLVFKLQVEHMHKYKNPIYLIVISLLSFVLISCAPPAYTVRSRTTSPPPLPSVTLYFYPTTGQSKAQQDRDRFECYQWAKKQTGYDPGQEQLAPHQRIEVQSATPPGSDAAAGAITGAVIGSMLSPRRDHGQSMVFGAITGAMLGAASEEAKKQQAEQLQQRYDTKDAQRYARLERQASDYRRAMSACLEGRGYTVR